MFSRCIRTLHPEGVQACNMESGKEPLVWHCVGAFW